MEQNNYKGCLMVTFEIPKWKEYITNYILPEDIYGASDDFGLELEPHVTVLYGLHNDTNVNKLKKKLLPLQYIKVNFNKISIFENEKFDVVKFDVASTQLNKLNKILTSLFDYKNDYPNYEPHATIAYVNKGCGKKYIKELNSPFMLIPVHYKYTVYYSDDNKLKTYFDIN